MARRRSGRTIGVWLLEPAWEAVVPAHLSRLQIAQQLHALLQRELGHAIEIERLLGEPRYARDVLLVCDALPNTELRALAALFRGELPPAVASAPTAVPSVAQPATAAASATLGNPGHARWPTEWSRDTSGFGVSRPAPVTQAPDSTPGAVGAKPPVAESRASWLARLTRW